MVRTRLINACQAHVICVGNPLDLSDHTLRVHHFDATLELVTPVPEYGQLVLGEKLGEFFPFDGDRAAWSVCRVWHKLIPQILHFVLSRLSKPSVAIEVAFVIGGQLVAHEEAKSFAISLVVIVVIVVVVI